MSAPFNLNRPAMSKNRHLVTSTIKKAIFNFENELTQQNNGSHVESGMWRHVGRYVREIDAGTKLPLNLRRFTSYINLTDTTLSSFD